MHMCRLTPAPTPDSAQAEAIRTTIRSLLPCVVRRTGRTSEVAKLRTANGDSCQHETGERVTFIGTPLETAREVARMEFSVTKILSDPDGGNAHFFVREPLTNRSPFA